MNHDNEIVRWSDLAIRVAQLGGRVLQNFFGSVSAYSIQNKSAADWVSEADRASECEILKVLSLEVPEHDILTEESGNFKRSEKSRYRWIIDPLDGTTNFIRGFPWWAVSVALEERIDFDKPWGRIVAAAIDIPPTGEIFSATVDRGAYRNGEKINIGEGRSFKTSLIGTGFPFRFRSMASSYMGMFEEFLRSCADIRRPGAVAIDLCYTAAGIFDGFWEFDLSPWDIAAAVLIITEAGGYVGDFQGGKTFLSSGDITAGNPRIYKDIVKITRQHLPQARTVEKAPGFTILN